MSYSINVRAKTKEEVKDKALAQLRQTLEGQPAHERDRESIYANVAAAVDAVEPVEGEEVVVEAHGSATAEWDGSKCVRITGSQQSVRAYISRSVTV